MNCSPTEEDFCGQSYKVAQKYIQCAVCKEGFIGSRYSSTPTYLINLVALKDLKCLRLAKATQLSISDHD